MPANYGAEAEDDDEEEEYSQGLLLCSLHCLPAFFEPQFKPRQNPFSILIFF